MFATGAQELPTLGMPLTLPRCCEARKEVKLQLQLT